MTAVTSHVEVLPVTALRAAELRRGRIVVRPLSPVSGALALVLLPDLLL